MSEAARSRLPALRERMRDAGADLVALAPGANMQWLLGFKPHADERPCLLLVGAEREAFLMPELNAEDSRGHTDIEFAVWSDAEGSGGALKRALSAAGASDARSVVLDDPMRADFALALLDEIPGAQRQFSGATLGELRLRKSEDEYRSLKENSAIADKAMAAAFEAIRPGVREADVAAAVRGCFQAEGAAPEFCIVGSGPNSAFPHHHTGSRELRRGDAVVIDLGGTKDGYWSDITRMAVVGEPPDGYEEIHGIVERASEAGRNAASDGAATGDVDAAARTVIADAGYGEYFVHRTGHGLGVEVHEPPYLVAGSDDVLRTGMVFSVEPGIYLPGRFGVRLEEIVILREDGPEIFSSLPRSLHVAAG